MARFTKYVPVHRGLDTVWFAPGDELPEWAEGSVGDHVLTTDSGPSAKVAPEPESPSEVDSDEPESPTPDATPDFTTPAAPRRGRPRKQ